MPESSKVNTSERDNSDQVIPAALGVAAFEGVLRRGPILRPDILITTLSQFRKLYGGIFPGSEFPQQCEKVLKSGGQLRINRVIHFADITDKTSGTALTASLAAAIKDTSPDPDLSLFNSSAKFAGIDYNDLRIIISNASNGKADYFNLTLQIITEAAEYGIEVYKNLKVTKTTVGNSHYLDDVNNQSNLAKFTYLDLSLAAGTPRPSNGTFNYVGGSNGDAVVANDYIGDQDAKTGLYSFDSFDDISDIATPNMSDAGINEALANYAETRRDLQALVHLSNAASTAALLVAARGNFDTKYVGIFAGGIKEVNPDDLYAPPAEYSEIADIVIINNYVDKKFFPWTSRANFVKGLITKASDVVNNFGGKGMENDLELLAQNQINMVVNSNRKIYLKGNFSGQLDLSKASYFNNVRGLIYVKKSLTPTLEKYLEEPNTISTFTKLFKEVEPFLDSLTTGEFLYKGAGVSKKGYDWNGDQNASDINNLQYNTKENLDKGIYNVGLDLYIINSIQVINFVISLNSLTQSVSINQTNEL